MTFTLIDLISAAIFGAIFGIGSVLLAGMMLCADDDTIDDSDQMGSSDHRN